MSKTSTTLLCLALAGCIVGGGFYINYSTGEKNKLKNDNKSLTETVTEITDENTQLKKDKRELYELITGKDNQITELQLGLETANKLKVEKEQELESLNIDLAEKTQLIEETNQIIENLNNKYDTLSQEKESLQTSLNECNNLLTEKTNQYNQVCGNLEIANGNITDLQKQKLQLENEITTLTSTKQSLQSQLNTKTKEYNDKVQELKTAQDEISYLNDDVSYLNSQVTAKTTEITTLNSQIKKLNATLQSLREENERLKGLLDDANIEYEYNLEGTYKYGSYTITLDNYGNGTFNSQDAEYEFSYSGDGNTRTISNFGYYNNNTLTLTSTGIIVNFSSKEESNAPSLTNIAFTRYNLPTYSNSYLLATNVSITNIDVVEINFIANNQEWTGIRLDEYGLCFRKSNGDWETWITDSNKSTGNIQAGYRTLIFETEPTGELKTWLESNKALISEETDGLEGTYIWRGNTITLDGKGNGSFKDTISNKSKYFTYTGDGDTKNVSNFGVYDSDENTFTITLTGIKVYFSDINGENVLNWNFAR